MWFSPLKIQIFLLDLRWLYCTTGEDLPQFGSHQINGKTKNEMEFQKNGDIISSIAGVSPTILESVSRTPRLTFPGDGSIIKS
jgi:hypothetical protein